MKKTKNKLLSIAVILFWATIVYAFSSGPPPSNTAAPGENNCTQCHGGSPNTGGGNATLMGLPQQGYVPGTRYNLTVTISQTGRSRWGFQLTALTEAGASAGTFETADANTQRISGNIGGNTRNYIQHTTTGTQRGQQNSATFNFSWTAPTSAVGNITFFLAANAANNNGASSGDSIYLVSTRLVPAASMPAAPTITAASPNSGPATGGTVVTIAGTGFRNASSVSFGSNSASTTFVDERTLRATTPAGNAGSVDITVRNPDGQVATLRQGFTYDSSSVPAPTLMTINPPTGSTAGGTEVTLTGTNFAQGARVMIGREATVTSVTSSQIVATTQPNDAAIVDVVVINPDGQTTRLNGGFTYTGEQQQPSLRLLTPNGGEVLSAGGLPFLVTWSQMSSSSATQMLELSLDGGTTFSTMIVTDLTSDRTSFSYAVPSGITGDQARIRISIIDNGSVMTDISDQNFRVLPAPVVTTIVPTVGSSIKLKITGSGFQTGATVEIDGTAAPSTKVRSATSINVKKISGSLAGQQVKVKVRNPDGTISAEQTVTLR